MGKTIANLEREEISEIFGEKMAYYFEIMSKIISADELVDKTSIMPELGYLIGDYYGKKDEYFKLLEDKSPTPEIIKSISEKKESLDSLENEINQLLNNEFSFINYLTRSKDGNTSGVEFILEDKKLFSGLNRQISERVFRNIQFLKEKNGEEFDFSSGDNEGFLIQIKDSVVIDFEKPVPEIYNMFFNGNGVEFYESLREKGLTDKEMILLSGMIDLSVNNDDESYTREYENIIKKLNKSVVKTIDEQQKQEIIRLLKEKFPEEEIAKILKIELPTNEQEESIIRKIAREEMYEYQKENSEIPTVIEDPMLAELPPIPTGDIKYQKENSEIPAVIGDPMHAELPPIPTGNIKPKHL